MRRAVLAAVMFASATAYADPPGMTDPVGTQPAPVARQPQPVASPTNPAAVIEPEDAPGLAPPGMTTPGAVGTPGRTYTPGFAPVAEQPVSTQPYVHSYRLQTLAADGLALVFVLAASSAHGNDGDSYAKLALGTYLLGGPIVHAAHGRTGRALGDLGLRIAIPVVAAYIGAGIGSRNSNSCTDYCDDEGDGAIAGAALGLVGGMLAASILDSAVLAKGDERPQTITPTIAPTQGGMSFGVAGAW